ncbi:membrane protein insertion efficiency factor YidD [Demequina sediminicola]|uniref:membrane protein insertion efficiency factor YidD n=1 Tax=Demequina sediminicola TaxID=1095026 RepID=UPI000785DAF4|nr:membrane protein insertion efficiency factor YidD [Demequina sediminicola]
MNSRSLGRAVLSVPRYTLIGVIRFYQLVISPLTGPRCKYYPSCSHYGLAAVREHGALVGFVLGAWRVLRCNPWSHGGVDDVPLRGEPLFRRQSSTSPEAAASLVQS